MRAGEPQPAHTGADWPRIRPSLYQMLVNGMQSMGRAGRPFRSPPVAPRSRTFGMVNRGVTRPCDDGDAAPSRAAERR